MACLREALDSFPEEGRVGIQALVDELVTIPRVEAVALGGSRARHAAREDSDVDLALYYREKDPFSIEAIRRVAKRFHLKDSPVVTDFYEWGPWVNGGAWLSTRFGPVDLLYRNLDQVSRVIDAARHGHVEWHFWQQPTYGFHSVVYLAETKHCIPLHDPTQALTPLKAAVDRYPKQLKHAVLRESLWGAQFSAHFARSSADAGDVYNAVGCFTRVLCQLTQALFALNETYFINDKGSLEAIEGFARRPDGYAGTVRSLLARPGGTRAALVSSTERLEELVSAVVELTHGEYQPKYRLRR